MFDWLNLTLIHVGNYNLQVGQLLSALLVLILSLTLSKWATKGFAQLAKYRNRRNDPQIYLVTRFIHYVSLFLGIAIAVSILGVTWDNLALIAGALGVGIGFGLQNIVSNFISGIIILVEKSLKVGDFIELESGIMGEVIEINIRYTLIRTADYVEILIPNSEFVSARVTNWTLNDETCRIRVPFGVAYGSDKNLVREVVLEAANKQPHTLENEQFKTGVLMTGFGDSSLDFVLTVWVVDEATRRPSQIRSDYLWAIEDAFRLHNIEIPFPQRDLHMRSGSVAAQQD